MISRMITKSIDDIKSIAETIIIKGMRQVGKSTFVHDLLENYITLDDLNNYSLAKQNPHSFISAIKTPCVIDEVQKVPELASEIKQQIDNTRLIKKHTQTELKYILTGSSMGINADEFSNALVGRSYSFMMHPLSEHELLCDKHNKALPTFIDFISSVEKYRYTKINKHVESFDLNRILIGGFPHIQNFSQSEIQLYFSSYLDQILNRDLSDDVGFKDKLLALSILRQCAANSSQLHVANQAAADLNVTYTTYKNYFQKLSDMFLLTQLDVHSTNINTSIRKSKKIHVSDVGLISYLLGLNNTQQLEDSIYFGHIFETFVIQEIIRQNSYTKKYQLKYFRDRNNKEVDLVIELPDSSIVAIEVKSTKNATRDDSNNIKYLKQVYKKKVRAGFVICRQENASMLDEDIFAIPVSSIINTKLLFEALT